jgi:hypothetical protein
MGAVTGRAAAAPRLRWALPLLAWLCLPAAAEAACPPARPVRFAAGASEITLSGGIPRGERECYTLRARQGQVLTVEQSDTPDTNIVFQIYQPPWRIAGAREQMAVGGTALPGTEEGEDARHFSGALPATGAYLLVVGTSRGSGEYRLRVEIRAAR